MKKVYLSADADFRLIEYIRSKGYDVVLQEAAALVAAPVSKHPDIYMCSFASADGRSDSTLNKSDCGSGCVDSDAFLADSAIFFGDASLLSEKYPGDVLYNAAAVGKYFICSKYTSTDLRAFAAGFGLCEVAVKQGYVKCNLVVVDGNHVITEDEGIYRVLAEKTDIECLLIRGGEAALAGYPRGFIGGCSGRVGDELIFNGDLSAHPDFLKIKEFVEDCGISLKYFSEYPLTDIGSIIAG